jgi:uncharacterized membrane protein
MELALWNGCYFRRVPGGALNLNSNRKGSLMAKIEKSIEVNAPLRTVYNQWTQFEEFPRFMEGVKEVRRRSSPRAEERRHRAARA